MEKTDGPATAATTPDEGEIDVLLDSLEISPRANLIAVLQDVQDRFGYLPPPALERIALRMKLPLSRVYGVVTFYSQFYTHPRGRHTVRCCRGTACHVKGSNGVLDAVRRELGVDEGETTGDKAFYLETVACLGTCFLAPVMMIDSQYYGKLTAQRIKGILKSYRAEHD